MPRPVHQARRWSIQYSCHSSSAPGLTKNSISICSNSRVRKMKLPGVISLRNDLPIWPMPNGSFLRLVVEHVLVVDEDALRGLRAQVVQAGLVLDRAEVGVEHAVELLGLGELALVAAVRAVDVGQAARPGLAVLLLVRLIRWSARNRLWQDWHSVSGSVNVATWPLASQTSRARITEESRPTTSSRSWTMYRHHWRLTLFFSSTPSGP